jgi:hypothetical protein
MEDDDKAWLDTLSGKPLPDEPTAAQLEAAAVRRALISRRDSLEADIRGFSSEKEAALRRRLRSHGFLKENRANGWVGTFRRLLSGGDLRVSGSSLQKEGIVAILFAIGIAVTAALLSPKPPPQLIPRGDGAVVYILDDDPERRVGQLVKTLRAMDAEFTQEAQSYGKVKIRIRAGDAVVELLSEQSIVPKIVDGHITLVISPTSVKN